MNDRNKHILDNIYWQDKLISCQKWGVPRTKTKYQQDKQPWRWGRTLPPLFLFGLEFGGNSWCFIFCLSKQSEISVLLVEKEMSRDLEVSPHLPYCSAWVGQLSSNFLCLSWSLLSRIPQCCTLINAHFFFIWGRILFRLWSSCPSVQKTNVWLLCLWFPPASFPAAGLVSC